MHSISLTLLFHSLIPSSSRSRNSNKTKTSSIESDFKSYMSILNKVGLTSKPGAIPLLGRKDTPPTRISLLTYIYSMKATFPSLSNTLLDRNNWKNCWKVFNSNKSKRCLKGFLATIKYYDHEISALGFFFIRAENRRSNSMRYGKLWTCRKA